jgi:hypothetical protein
LLWPVAFIWAFATPFGVRDDAQSRSAKPDAAQRIAALRAPSGDKETRP